MNMSNQLQTSNKKIGLIIGIIAIVLITAGLGYWVFFTGRTATLFADLDEADSALMIEQLDTMKVPYEIGDDGKSILVDENVVHEVRLKLMAQGVALKGGVGFEIFDDAEFGMTEYAQKINYQRALQGELSRTITSLNEVKFARVHLVLPESALFAQERSTPKASVTLMVKEGAHLSKARISGIQRLVAASVPKIEASQVTVLDQRGVTLSIGATGGEYGAGLDARLEEKRALEEYLTNKALEVLNYAYGHNKAIVKVDVTLNHDRVKKTSERLIPAVNGENESTGVVIRKRITQAQNPVATENAQGGKQQVVSNNASTSEVEYRVSRVVEESDLAPGEIERMSVGVILQEKLDRRERARIEEMVSMVVGLNTRRGDAITIHTVAAGDELEPTTSAPQSSVTTAAIIEPASGDQVSMPIEFVGHMQPIGLDSPKLPPKPVVVPKPQWRQVYDEIAAKPKFVVGVLGGLFVLLLLSIIWPRGGRRSKPMSEQEREVMLRDISDWIGVKPAKAEGNS